MEKIILFYTFLIVFVATAVITLLGVIKKVSIREKYLNTLFFILLVQLVGSVIGLYKTTDFFKSTHNKDRNYFKNTLVNTDFVIFIISTKSKEGAIQKTNTLIENGFNAKTVLTKSGYYGVIIPADSELIAQSIIKKLQIINLANEDIYLSTDNKIKKIIYPLNSSDTTLNH